MKNNLHVCAIIPARYAASRFPGKMLAAIAGQPMIERVWRQVKQATLVDRVLVATDDARIASVVEALGGEFVMTKSDHLTGTDRLAEAASLHPEIDIVVNVQGDEPLIDPRAIDAAVQPLLANPTVEMATLASPIQNADGAQRAHLVKVVVDKNSCALYFSRSPIPFYRNDSSPRRYLGHIGIYVYRRQCLLNLAQLPPTELELAESLEQLRALENGIKIQVVECSYQGLAVDVPQDVAAVEAVLAQNVMQATRGGNL